MSDLAAPLDRYRDVVRPEWIDHNRHMNVGYYLVVFDFATDEFFRWVGLDEAQALTRVLKTDFALERISVKSPAEVASAVMQAHESGGIRFFIVDAPAEAFKPLADAVKGRDILVFNATAADDTLRRNLCAAEFVHTLPSLAMRMDALTQYLVSRKWGNLLVLEGPLPADAVMTKALENSAKKFGARIKLAARATQLSSRDGIHAVTFENGETISAKSIIIATGARYNRLPLDRLAQFEGAGVFYAATQMEAQTCVGRTAVVVGGGNSAGQAAMFLARTCARVNIMIRGDSLASSMSRYLIDQIEHHPLIEVLSNTEVTRLVGDAQISAVEIRHAGTGAMSILDTCGLFVFIGAKPATEWLGGQIAVDKHGFVLTGPDLPQDIVRKLDRPPLLLETSRPGIFCVGDVRAGSVKRTATAIGEGSMAVRLVFDRLQSTGLAATAPPRPGAAG